MKCKMLGGTFPENATLTKDGDINTGFMVNTSIIGKIENITQITEENKGNFLGKTARGVGGFVLFGGIGALAGVLSGKDKKEVTVSVELKDGMGEFLAIVDVEALQKLYVWQKNPNKHPAPSPLSVEAQYLKANSDYYYLPPEEQAKVRSQVSESNKNINKKLIPAILIIFVIIIYLFTR